MYKKRFLIDEENEMFYRLKEIKEGGPCALHLKGSEDTLVVMTQQDFLELKMAEDELLTSRGLRESMSEEYSEEKLSQEFEEKMKKIQEKTEAHEKDKIQGVSVIEEND